MNDELQADLALCLTDDMRLQADVALADVVAAHVFSPALAAGAQTRCLALLHLTYWQAWYDRAGMWLADAERTLFAGAIRSLTREGLLDERVLMTARLTGEADAADTCAVARGR